MTESSVTLSETVRRVRAPNPSPMTERGTNTYILGRGNVAVIDPGPAIGLHLEAILAALAPGERVSHILVTHAHLDHSPLAVELAAATDAPVYGFGGATEGRTAIMASLAAKGMTGGGEGLDHEFAPDIRMAEGDTLEAESWRIEAIHTPGHIGSHLVFAAEEAVFSGDHVMGWATTMVSPPDGDIGAFMASCRKLQGRGHAVYYPGHGDPVADPEVRLNFLLAHRAEREDQILAGLAAGPSTVRQLVFDIYRDIDQRLHAAAARNVFAHLVELWARGVVSATPDLAADAVFFLS